MDSDAGVPLVSIRTMNIVVALLLMIVAGIVMIDSVRLGIGWTESAGPAAGYFPFYIGLFLALASGVNLVRALFVEPALGRAQGFVARRPFQRVLLVFLPLAGYVLVLTYIGIYVASAVYIALFMWHFGRYRPWRGALVGLSVAVVLFLMFEVWFLVPLPKGPIEELLGY